MKNPRLLSIITALLLLCATPSMAGWGDTLKEVGGAAADAGATAAGLPYTPSEAIAGIKEVLSIGTDYATTSLSKPGGFSSNPASAFSLPSGLGSLGDASGLLSSLNTAAEKSVPGTGNVILDAISNLSIGDPSSLLGGSNDAITRYFENSSRASIKKLIIPVVESSVKSAGVDTYLNALGAGMTGTSFNAVDFVAEKTLDGMFSFIAMKEKDLRAGGAGTTDLIKKLF